MINPKGEIEAFYDKINMFDVRLSKKETHNESKMFVPGKKLCTLNPSPTMCGGGGAITASTDL